jgi:hypothetical protein
VNGSRHPFGANLLFRTAPWICFAGEKRKRRRGNDRDEIEWSIPQVFDSRTGGRSSARDLFHQHHYGDRDWDGRNRHDCAGPRRSWWTRRSWWPRRPWSWWPWSRQRQRVLPRRTLGSIDLVPPIVEQPSGLLRLVDGHCQGQIQTGRASGRFFNSAVPIVSRPIFPSPGRGHSDNPRMNVR